MLFGYMNQRRPEFRDDVVSQKAPIECFSFERPLILASELHVAGAMAFATSFGFVGMSLVEWALNQSLSSAAQRLSNARPAETAPEAAPPPRK
jgi:hypothetical protein